MTGSTHRELSELLVRHDGQEDLCLALYRPSTGRTRSTALVYEPIAPAAGDRHVHGNVTVTADYILRGAGLAQESESGLVVLHSHPGGRAWQRMSGPDRDAEASYANLVRELTGMPLVGMTLAGGDAAWSARHWDTGVGSMVAPTECTHVRVVDDRFAVTWNDALAPPPSPNRHQARTVSAWGETVQADLARLRVLVVGAGSVGLDVAVRLAASGHRHITIMDFDVVEEHNLDRLIGGTQRDALLRRPKTYVARREALRAATASDPRIRISDLSICEPDGLREALDHDIIICCVDRPWPRAVLNSLAYTDLIPVVDGGIAIDTHANFTMRGATWRSHIVRPGRPCMNCSRQLDMGRVALDIQGLLDDPTYIGSVGVGADGGQNVALLSINVAATLLAQYVSFIVAPAGIGDPGPLQYILSTHELEHLKVATNPDCMYEPSCPIGDARQDLTGHHAAAEIARSSARTAPVRIRLLRVLDDCLTSLSARLDRAARTAALRSGRFGGGSR